MIRKETALSSKMSHHCLVLFSLGAGFFIGCATSSTSHRIDGYETQKRIVWQGTLTVNLDSDIFRMIYFGYDRNGDFSRLTSSSPCRGVDLLEYKGLATNGEWTFNPIIILLDDDYDCYANRVFYDCDGDGTPDKVVEISNRTVKLEVVDQEHRRLIQLDCLKYQRHQ